MVIVCPTLLGLGPYLDLSPLRLGALFADLVNNREYLMVPVGEMAWMDAKVIHQLST